MKKLLSVMLILTMLCVCAAAIAETWTCAQCGKESEGNFCSWCGAGKPAEKIVCPSCGAEYAADAGFAFCNQCGASLTANTGKIVREVAIGDVITLGQYEQDNDLSNGSEAIDWVVLDVQDGKALVISKYALDAIPYHAEKAEITWEACTLRSWLNNEFLNTAFSAKEQSAILLTTVDNSSAQGYSGYYSYDGNNTEDRIFLLSYNEAFNVYFHSNNERVCRLTPYALANVEKASPMFQVEDIALWWLRSPGENAKCAARIDDDGGRINSPVHREDLAIRPVMWLDLSSL